jgi:hypothetical protein
MPYIVEVPIPHVEANITGYPHVTTFLDFCEAYSLEAQGIRFVNRLLRPGEFPGTKSWRAYRRTGVALVGTFTKAETKELSQFSWYWHGLYSQCKFRVLHGKPCPRCEAQLQEVYFYRPFGR